MKKGDVPVMGTTKLTPEAIEKLRTRKAPFPLQKYLPMMPQTIKGPADKEAQVKI